MIGLSVAMLGSAPGTDLLNQWVAAMLDDGMSIEDIANHIASSDAFLMAYPRFLSNEDFATDFLNNLMGSEEVPDALMSLAVDLVVSLLNDGMSRGELALAAVMALYDVHDQGEAHPSYGDLGMVATAFANKIEVADYYTVDLRQANPNSRVLHNVDSETGLDDIRDSISDYLDPPEPISLTSSRDNIVGTMANDEVISEPDSRGEDTLDPFDVVDGGAGEDTFRIYASEGITIDVNGVDVRNVENAYLSARQAITVDLSEWEGLESVTLGRFGNASDVSVTVDGASVSTVRTFGGDVTIIGASGEVNLNAAKTSTVKVGSGEHSTSVMVKGGETVDVSGNGAVGSAASQSMTVTSVVLDGVKGEGLGGDGKRSNPMETVPNPLYDADATGSGADTYKYLTSAGQTAIDGKTAGQTDNDVLITLTGDDAHVTNTMDDALMRERMFKDGKRVDPDTEGAVSGKDSGSVPIHVYSDAIESVSLSNTYATAAVINKSKEAEDIMVTVDKYGSATVDGKLCLGGSGAAENVSIMVAGDSNFALANDKTKTVSVSGDGALTLAVTDFVSPPDNVNAGGDKTPKASVTLESVTLSGGGKFTMNAMGLSKLKSIDASAASGDVAVSMLGASVTSYDGSSASDRIDVAAFAEAGIAVDLGAGNDTFTSAGGNGKSRVDGGEGMDTLQLTGNSATHKVDGKDVSIFSNFETLDIGASATATHDVKLLGVDSVIVSASTADSDDDTAGLQASVVTLNNMADGMGISVSGKAGTGITAAVVHDMADRKAGQARYSGELAVSLTANGGSKDKATSGTGTADLTLTADGEIEILDVASNANAGGKASSATYRNMLTISGDGTAIEAVDVTGNAMLTIAAASGTTLSGLELVDAGANSGGVTFNGGTAGDGSPLAQALELVGGSGKDMFTGGAEADKLTGNGGTDTLVGGDGTDTITGGAGGDTMTGGAGAEDTFKYGSASESQVTFSDKGMSGFDTITDFVSGTDKIALGKTLYEKLQGTLREYTGDDAIDVSDTADPDPTDDSLKAFLDSFKGDGVFESRGTPVDGAINDKGELMKHSIATVTETYWSTAPVVDDPDTATDESADGVSAIRTWVLIDVDGDGDFDASVDMAIALTGTVDLAAGDFEA